MAMNILDKNLLTFFFYYYRALQPPGWLKEWHVGVRVTKSNKLVGFISAIPALLNVYNK